MKIEKKKNGKLGDYYSFIYYDRELKKPVRLKKEEIHKRFGKVITNLEEAKKLAKELEKEMESEKNKYLSRLDWQTKNYEMTKLLAIYEEAQKKRAPNSWKNNIHYLKFYVLPFFMNEKQCDSLSKWPEYYGNFIQWLEEEATLLKNPKKLISYGSKNHAIKALNTFMGHLFRSRVIEKHILCESFHSKFLNEKGAEELISNEEMEAVYNELNLQSNHLEAVFFRFLYFTGLRFNEGLGICPGDIYDDRIQKKSLEGQLANANIEYHGYILLSSQPSHETRGLRNKDGHVIRKPLKGRFKINDKNSRTIVITDLTLWNELVELNNKAIEKRDNGLFGDQIGDYPIFEGIDKTTSSKKLKKAFAARNLKPRTWHSCRHTRATMLIGETGNNLLAKLWLGHSSDRILNRYVHIYEEIVRKLKRQEDGGNAMYRKLQKK